MNESDFYNLPDKMLVEIAKDVLNDQPKPATEIPWRDVAAAKDAEITRLTTEVQKLYAEVHNLSEAKQRLMTQLAAERGELVELHSLVKINDELRKQLDAEMERVKHLFNLYLWTDKELKELKSWKSVQ